MRFPLSEHARPAAAEALEVPLPLLVTGVAGVPGFNAVRYFHERYPGQVVGVRQEDNRKLEGPHIVACDIENREGLRRLFDQYQFRAVLNASGSCKLKNCELDPALAWRVNVEGTQNLLDVIGTAPVRLVHLSIDLVFSGNKAGNHAEEDATDPVTVYGKTMVLAEQLLKQHRPQAAVLRISLPMGVSFNGHAGAIDWIQSRFQKSKPATLYYDEFRTPTYCDCLSQVCAAVLASNLTGLFHAGGPRKLSLYQIGQIVNRVGGYDPRHLMGCQRAEAGPMPPRAGDVTMNSSRLSAALGYNPFDPWPLHEEHVPTHQEWHFEGPRGSPELLAQALYRNPAPRQMPAWPA